MRIIYVPLEPYKSRYTLQLREWNEREFRRLGVDYLVVEGISLDKSQEIKTGAVLDAHQRVFYALSQIQELISMLYRGILTKDDFILFEDMFHPGIEGLFYALALQYGPDTRPPAIGLRCLAQTIDPDDFIYYTGMSSWMRKYEQMVTNFPGVGLIFAASTEMVSHMQIAGWDVPVVVTGLPFGKDEVVERLGSAIKPFHMRKKRVVFASRLAEEKQPEFFLALAERFHSTDVEFAIIGGGLLKYPGLDQAVIKNHIQVYANLSKEEYYAILNDSRVLFNCSLQDWVSNTLSEADALGCNVLFPAYRSFPEALNNNEECLYIPWSLSDAEYKLRNMLKSPTKHVGSFSDEQNSSIYRTIKSIQQFMSPEGINVISYIGHRSQIVVNALEKGM